MRQAVEVVAMPEAARRLFDVLLECMTQDASLIAALKAANAELREVVELLATETAESGRTV